MSKKTERSAVSPLLIGGAVVISLVIAVIIGMNLEKGSNDSPATDSPDPATADGTEDAVDEEQREWGESMALREADEIGRASCREREENWGGDGMRERRETRREKQK